MSEIETTPAQYFYKGVVIDVYRNMLGKALMSYTYRATICGFFLANQDLALMYQNINKIVDAIAALIDTGELE